jgi:hypothetical protein
MKVWLIRTQFEMSDRRRLECEFEEANDEFGDPVFYIDGIEAKYNHLPKGLAVIADDLANPVQSRGGYSYERSLIENTGEW